MGGKARQPVLRRNQRRMWVLRGTDGHYAKDPSPHYTPVGLGEAYLFNSQGDARRPARWWNSSGALAVEVIVTTKVEEV